MASAYFRAAAPAGGGRLDIHAGGVDIRFPHHENELAAAEAHAAGAAAAPATTACVVCAALPADLLRLCDEVRDGGLRRGLGVILHDADARTGGGGTWTRG